MGKKQTWQKTIALQNVPENQNDFVISFMTVGGKQKIKTSRSETARFVKNKFIDDHWKLWNFCKTVTEKHFFFSSKFVILIWILFEALSRIHCLCKPSLIAKQKNDEPKKDT